MCGCVLRRALLLCRSVVFGRISVVNGRVFFSLWSRWRSRRRGRRLSRGTDVLSRCTSWCGSTLVLCLLFLACAPAPPVVLRLADAARTGAPGDDGRLGALLVTRTFLVRGDRPLEVDVVVPSDGNGDVAAGPFAPVLLVQGGAVSVERYHWLAAHLATRGFVVVAPHHIFDLAFFSQGDGLDALAALRRASADDSDDVLGGRVSPVSALAIGHSLGGVVASNAFAGDEQGVSHLVLLASVPNPGVDVSRASGRVLSIAGENDGLITVDEVVEGAKEFAAPITVAVVQGLTHFQLTDEPTPENLEREGTTSPLPLSEARRRALFLVDAMLLDLMGDAAGVRLLENQSLWPQGVVIP
jgi:pimeloyl-ACP methyl ester carboxylesterase